MNVQSQLVYTPQAEFFTFLSDLNNLGNLLPSSVSGFESDGKSCSFKLSGLGTIKLEKKEELAPEKIVLQTKDEKPFPVFLHIRLEPHSEGCMVHMDVDAKINPFMRMMVEKPLEKFLNELLQSITGSK